MARRATNTGAIEYDVYWSPYRGPPEVIRGRTKMGGGESENCEGWRKGNGK